MKILMLVDLEGASGVVDNDEQARPGSSLYQEARDYLLSDVNAAVEGAIAGGAEEVIIFDMHYFGLNLNLAKISSKSRVIMGKPRKVYPLLKEIYKEVSGFIMVGFHAMAQAEGSLLPHTYDHSIKSLRLNQVLVGEIGMEAAIAGFYGIPLILVGGDSKGVEEAQNLLGDIPTVTVKQAINQHSALCLPLEKSREEMRKRAQEAVEKISQIKPFCFDPPYTIEVEFFQPAKVQKMLKLAGVEQVDDLVVRARGEDLPLLWENFIGFCQDYD